MFTFWRFLNLSVVMAKPGSIASLKNFPVVFCLQIFIEIRFAPLSSQMFFFIF